MVELNWQTARRGGVTLIAATVDNRQLVSGVEAHRVTLDVRLDGNAWPPRIDGIPVDGWEDGTLELTVPVGAVSGVGVAGDGEPGTPPIALLDVEPADESPPDPDPVDVLRALGDPTPPREAVPLPIGNDSDPYDESNSEPETKERATTEGADTKAQTTIERPGSRSSPSRAPAAVEGWLGAIERRIENGTDAELAADRTHLRRVRRQVATLSRRVERALGKHPSQNNRLSWERRR